MQQGNFELTIAGTSYNALYLRDKSHAIAAIEQLERNAGERSPFGLDFETCGTAPYRHDPSSPLDPLRSLPRLVQICDGRNIVVLDLLHIGSLDFLIPFFSRQRFVAHNAIFEIQHLLHNFSVPVPDVGCTKIATRLVYDAIYPNSAAFGADLGNVCKSLLKIELPKDIDHRCWANAELTKEQLDYAAMDAGVMRPIAEKLTVALQKYGLLNVYNLYKQAQIPLAKMQLNGIQMNADAHVECIAEWKINAYQAKKELLALTGLKDTNPKSIIAYLETTLPPEILAIWPLTDGGEDEKEGDLSLSADTFSDFSFLPIVEPFSRFKKATKLSSTYGTKLLNRTNRHDGRIHCSFNLCGTRTGRLSSSNPNLQQLPRDKRTRALFIAAPGRKFVVADFNQIELRVAAEWSRDEEMLRAYRQGRDLHVVTAEMLSGRKLDTMTDEARKHARQSAKALNFGLLFGLGKKKFRHYAHKNYGAELTEDQAYEAVSAWHSLYSGYSRWHRDISSKCEVSLKVRTATGKLRALSRENYYGASANTPVQGSASECMLRSLVRLNGVLSGRSFLCNTVHDEIMIETDDTSESVAEVKFLLNDCMTKGFQDIFPNGVMSDNLVEVKSGSNWAEAH